MASLATETMQVQSRRVALARLARDAAVRTEGVAEVDAGPNPARATITEGERIAGVTVAALPSGRYGVSVYVTARLVPLPRLAAAIRDEITRAAESEGLAEQLGEIDVTFTDVRETGGPV